MFQKKKMMAVLLLALGISQSVSASAGGAYDRSGSVAIEERRAKEEVPMVGDPEVDPKAWRKVDGVFYNGSGVAIPGAVTRGIDVSEWQGKIDWSEVRASDVDFAFVRISYGGAYLDKTYDYNMSAANAAGVPVGTYVYSTATTAQGALEEAQLAIRKMHGYQVSYPVVYDVEYSAMRNLTPIELSAQILTFCNEIKKAGYYPMVYSNVDWVRNYINMDMIRDVDFWLAQYGDRINAPNRTTYRYSIWQCTDGDGGGILNPTKGLIRGIPIQNNIDLNFGFVDYTKVIVPRTSAKSDYVPSRIANSGYTGWVHNGSETYYYRNGEMLRGSQYIGGQNYRFSQTDGHLFKDMVLSSSTTGKVVYVDPDGVRVSSQWVTYKDKTYYFGSDGYAYKGHRKVGEYYYYFHPTTGVMYSKYLMRASNGVIYYFDEKGHRATNTFKTLTDTVNNFTGTWCFGSTGRAYKGWHIVGHRRYYFYPGRDYKAGTMARNVTLKIGQRTYTFGEKGQVLRSR